MEDKTTLTCKIYGVNKKGLGLANINGKVLEVPFCLEGDEVEINPVNNLVVKVNQCSKFRINPSCKYFGTCGGCSMQHAEENKYIEWKHERLKKHLTEQSINPCEIKILQGLYPEKGLRRRVSISYRNRGDNFVIGFNQPNKSWVMNIEICPILTTGINSAIEFFRTTLPSVVHSGQFGHIEITEAENGIDAVLHITPSKEIKVFEEQNFISKILENATKYNITKISAGKKVIFLKEEPFINFGKSSIQFISGGFLQASKKSEDLMVNFVLNHCKKSNIKKAADLFCGQGSFSIPIAENGFDISAYDINKSAIKILKQFASNSNIKLNVETPVDLFTNPVEHEILNKFDLIVLDPPRSGAKAQIEQIIQSNTKHVVYVSCNEETFSLDAKMLTESGFKIEEIQLFDQFAYTHHTELIGIFKK